MIKKILVAIDGSDHAWKALDLAAEMAESHEAELRILHVVPYQDLPDAYAELARAEHVPIEEEQARFHRGRTRGDEITAQAEDRVRANGLQSANTGTEEPRRMIPTSSPCRTFTEPCLLASEGATAMVISSTLSMAEMI